MLVKLLNSSSDAWMRASAGALKNLSVDEENKAEISRNDGVKALLGMLAQQDVLIVGKSAECLGNFALDEAHRTRIREMDGVVLLLNLLDAHAQSDATRLAAVGALLNLAVDDECKSAIRYNDGIAKLVPL